MISYTYLLIDPRTDKPFYVGQTCDPYQRRKTHYYNRKRPDPKNVGLTPTQERICEIFSAGLRPTMKIVGKAWDHWEAREMEDGWMRKLAEEGYELTNTMSVKTNGRGHYKTGFAYLRTP